MSWDTNRKTPYLEATIGRQPCIRCGDGSAHQWSICADGNRYRPVCLDCDIELNRLVLTWMRHPFAGDLIAEYESRRRAEKVDE